MRKIAIVLLLLPLAVFASQRFVILEGFTNSQCGYCPPANAAWEAADDTYHDDMGLIIWHMSWPGYDPLYHYNTTDNDQRKNFYGVSGVPATFCDGTSISYGQTSSYVSSRIGVPSPMEITLDGNITGDQGYLDARFEWTDTVEDNIYRAYFIICESNLSASGRQYDYSMRVVEPDYPGWLVPGNTGVHYHRQYFDVDSAWKLDDLVGYVVVQDFFNKTVIQGARVDVDDWQTAVTPTSWGMIKALD